MTKKAIEKLSDKARAYCEEKQKIIRVQNANGNREIRNEYAKKLRGYLECLEDVGKITHKEMQTLYLFYATM